MLNNVMANPEHLAILKHGSEIWNRWRTELLAKSPPNRTHQLDLSGANLAGETLVGFNFSNQMGRKLKGNLAPARILVNLEGANFSGSHLNVSLDGTRLCGANLSEALVRGKLIRTDLTGADLSNASFLYVYLDLPVLSDANFDSVSLGWTESIRVDLSTVKNLDGCIHDGPSTMSIDTFYRSHGNIPEVFLRGCGVPEQFITYAKSLTINAIQFYSCFISYSKENQEFAERVYADLQNHGVRCWFAPHHIQGGKKILEQIDEAIRVYDRLLLILSDSSMNSEWVKTEIANARQREIREGRQMLFPISLVPYDRIKEWKAFDADTGKDSAPEIREYFIPDFSNWKDHDSYQQAFQRLLRDLKAES
jgi:hypothetical protein